jgi:hypothetical protein
MSETKDKAIADLVDRLTARVQQLEAALRPFADLGTQLVLMCADEDSIEIKVRVGDLREAKEASK